jgi:hypothetical protein
MPFYGLSIFGLIFHSLYFFSEMNVWNFIAIIILGTSSIYFIRSLVLSIIDSTEGRIVLYFKDYLPKADDGEWAYPYGNELAKNLKKLIYSSKVKKRFYYLILDFMMTIGTDLND